MGSYKLFMRGDLAWLMPPKPKKKATKHPIYFREWRQYRELTQEQAAERLHMDQSTLSRIERGIVPYDRDFLAVAAFAYMCEPADLLIRNPLQRDAVWSIMDNLRKATPAEQEQLRAIAEAFLKKTG